MIEEGLGLYARVVTVMSGDRLADFRRLTVLAAKIGTDLTVRTFLLVIGPPAASSSCSRLMSSNGNTRTSVMTVSMRTAGLAYQRA